MAFLLPGRGRYEQARTTHLPYERNSGTRYTVWFWVDDGRKKLDDILWSIAWSAALTPDLHMIPNRIVFLRVPQGSTSRPIREGIETSLLSRSGAFLDRLLGTNTAEEVDDTAPAWEPVVDGLSGGEGDSYAITTCASGVR